MALLDAESLRDLGMKTTETLTSYLNDNEGWHVGKKSKDMVIEYKHSKCPGFETGYLYRGQAEYSCPKETVFKYINPIDSEDCLRKKWDKDIRDLKLLRLFDSHLRIMKSMTNSAAMGLISPREFVDLIMIVENDNCISVNAVSVESDEFPPDSKYVRGWNYPCGLMCMSISEKPNHTRLVTFIQPDIKGMLPRSLVDSAIPGSMVGFFNNLRAILKKDGQLDS